MHTAIYIYIYIYTNVLGRVPRVRTPIWSFYRFSSKRLKKAPKKRKKAQKGSQRRSKRLFKPARCRQCARRGCSSLLRCRLCVRRGCSRLLFEITIRKCWARLHCALSHCTLLCFAPCMYMHGSTLVYIYIYIYLLYYACIVLSFAPSAAAVWQCDHVRIPCESNSVRHSVFS